MKLKDVRRLRLAPGDALVVTLDHHPTADEAEAIIAGLVEACPGHRVFVHGPGVELSVVVP